MMETDVTRQSFGAILMQFVLLAALLWGYAVAGGLIPPIPPAEVGPTTVPADAPAASDRVDPHPLPADNGSSPLQTDHSPALTGSGSPVPGTTENDPAPSADPGDGVPLSPTGENSPATGTAIPAATTAERPAPGTADPAVRTASNTGNTAPGINTYSDPGNRIPDPALPTASNTGNPPPAITANPAPGTADPAVRTASNTGNPPSENTANPAHGTADPGNRIPDPALPTASNTVNPSPPITADGKQETGSTGIAPDIINTATSDDNKHGLPAKTTVIPGQWINGWAARFPYAALALSLVIVFINAFVITRTVSRNLVYPTRTYLPCLFYLLVSCGICFPGFDLAAVMAAYLVVWATVDFISSFVRQVSFGTTFRGAFFIGLTPLLEPQNAIYILFVPVAAAVFRRCPREITVAFLGALMPTLLTAYIYWCFGEGFTGLYETIGRDFLLAGQAAPLFTTDPAGVTRIAAAAVAAVVLLLSAASFIGSASDMRTRAYKIQVFALWFLVFAGLSLAMPSRTAGNFAVLAIPWSILAPALFVRFRGAVPLILYVLIITGVAVAALTPFFL